MKDNFYVENSKSPKNYFGFSQPVSHLFIFSLEFAVWQVVLLNSDLHFILNEHILVHRPQKILINNKHRLYNKQMFVVLELCEIQNWNLNSILNSILNS